MSRIGQITLHGHRYAQYCGSLECRFFRELPARKPNRTSQAGVIQPYDPVKEARLTGRADALGGRSRGPFTRRKPLPAMFGRATVSGETLLEPLARVGGRQGALPRLHRTLPGDID
jgi:hypothetical protein